VRYRVSPDAPDVPDVILFGVNTIMIVDDDPRSRAQAIRALVDISLPDVG
jgi:hypothetical protein